MSCVSHVPYIKHILLSGRHWQVAENWHNMHGMTAQWWLRPIHHR